jgi:hypothetical protein
VALPFIVAAALIVAGAIIAVIVLGRLGDRLNRYAYEQGVADELPETFKPDAIKQFSGWTVDCAQVLTGLLAPLVGLVVLRKHGTSTELQLAYLGAFILSLAVFAWFLRRDLTKYGTSSLPVFTPVVALTFLVNVAAAAGAYLIGP